MQVVNRAKRCALVSGERAKDSMALGINLSGAPTCA